MDKETLVKKILNASQIEESHSSVIARFFLRDFDWSGIDKEKAGRSKKILEVIEEQTMNHERMLNDLLTRIRESEHNEF